MRRKLVLLFALLLLLSGCGSFVPVTDISKVDPSILKESYKVKTFTVENSSYPEVNEHLGEVTAYSCKNLMWDKPASKGDALAQLRIKALELGADGIINVTFDTRGTDTFGTNCWESVQATGVAVKFKR